MLCFQSSVIGSGFGSLNAPKQIPAADIRTSEHLNGPRLGQRTNQMATASSSNVSKEAGPPPVQSPALAHSPSADAKTQRAENSPIMSQNCKCILQFKEHGLVMIMYLKRTEFMLIVLLLLFLVEMKLQPEPSAGLSQLAQRQQQSSILTTTEPLGLSQSHAPQVPTPPGRSNIQNCVLLC